jgi:PAS domain S-box-containing protein
MRNSEEKITNQQNREGLIYAEKVRTLHRQIPPGILPSFLCSACYGLIVWDTLPHWKIAIWFLIQMSIFTGRIYLHRNFKKTYGEITYYRRWKNLFSVLTYLSGLTWGSAAIFLFPENAPDLKILLIFLTGGLAAGTVGTYAVFSEIVTGYIVLTLSPFAFQYFFLQGDDASHWIAVFIVVLGTAMISTAKRVQGSVISALELAEDLKVEVKERRLAEAALKKVRDVLDERVRERTSALSQANDHLRKLTNAIEQAIEIIVISDLEGKIEYVNPVVEKVTGFSINEFIGNSFELFQRSGKQESPFNEIFQTILTGKDWNGEVVNQKKSGEEYITDMTISPVYNDQRRITHFVAVMRDITDRKRLEQDLLQASKLSSLGTLTSGIAHELNTPLATILGFSEEIVRDNGIKTLVRKHAEWITQESNRCVSIVRNLLNFSRKHKPNTVVFNINEAITTVLTLYNYQLKSDLIEVKTALSEEPLFVLGDTEQIQQVILNIFLNAHTAIESTNLKGTVKVLSHQTDNRIIITIENNGPHIPKDHLQKIFDPFFTNSNVGEGTGLGLSVSYGIVEEHQGQIRAENIGTKGVRFLITLPLSEKKPEEKEDEGIDTLFSTGLRVLIVEDDDKFRNWLEMFLTQKGAITTKVSNGVKAIDHLKKTETDLILSDLKMPVMGGADLCQWIEKHQPGNLNKFIFLSGVTDTEIDKYCSEKEIPFLVKPVKNKELLLTMKRVSEAVREK